MSYVTAINKRGRFPSRGKKWGEYMKVVPQFILINQYNGNVFPTQNQETNFFLTDWPAL